MAHYRVYPADKDNVEFYKISHALKLQLPYFVASSEDPDVPPLKENECWIRLSDAENWLEEGVFYVVSPLDVENKTEVEISEEQEDFLIWLTTNSVQYIRVEEIE